MPRPVGSAPAFSSSHTASFTAKPHRLHIVTYLVTLVSVIKSFAHKGLERYFLTGNLAGIQVIHAKRLRLILAQLDKAKTIGDMDIPILRQIGRAHV